MFTLLVFLAGLSLLILIHELGHYLPAKWFGMRVEKFYLFFDWPRKLFSWTRGGTEYGVGILPLGGYVKIAGMVDESLDTDQIASEPKPDEFRSKPVWQRAIVMVGGVTMNVLLAIVIYSFFKYSTGEVRLPVANLPQGVYVPANSIGHDLGFRTGDQPLTYMGQPLQYLPGPSDMQTALMEREAWYEVERNGQRVRIDIPSDYLNKLADQRNSPEALAPVLFTPRMAPVISVTSHPRYQEMPAHKAGLQDNDRIQALVTGSDTLPIESFNQLPEVLGGLSSPALTVVVDRQGSTVAVPVQLDSSGQLGIAAAQQPQVEVEKYSVLGAIGAGTTTAFRTVTDQILGFGKIFRGEVAVSKSLSGPVRIAKVMGDSAQQGGLAGFFLMLALLSMVLAFVNILPIPALDGGHLVFLLIEAVTRREPSLKVRMVAQQIGMVLILCLMVFVLFNDALSLLS